MSGRRGKPRRISLTILSVSLYVVSHLIIADERENHHPRMWMIHVKPIVLEANAIRLEPLGEEHTPALAAAAQDGELWKLWFTVVPAPNETGAYVEAALRG